MNFYVVFLGFYNNLDTCFKRRVPFRETNKVFVLTWVRFFLIQIDLFILFYYLFIYFIQ